jgi:hypothetical protein
MAAEPIRYPKKPQLFNQKICKGFVFLGGLGGEYYFFFLDRGA